MSDDALMGCKVAPSGRHCLHAHPIHNNYNNWGVVDKSPLCCWCGESITQHGEFLPTYANPWTNWTITNTTNATPTYTTGGTFPTAGGNWVHLPSGSVGHGG